MKPKAIYIAAFVIATAVNVPLHASEILINGGFESGFSGWSRADQLGGDGTFAIQTGGLSPVNGDPVSAPPQGGSTAMSDGAAPGSHLLWQDFTISSLTSQVILSFDLFIGNRAQVFVNPTPATLDFGINAANQQVRVDLLTSTGDPFSVSGTLLGIYQSQPGNALVAGYLPLSFDITPFVNAHLGQFRLRFAEVDNLAELQLGVDAVSVNAVSAVGSVPEPSTLLLTLSVSSVAMLIILCDRSRRRAAR